MRYRSAPPFARWSRGTGRDSFGRLGKVLQPLEVLNPEVRELIARHFDSLESIEILLLLRRSPQTYWGAPAIAEQLGIAPDITRAKLDALRGSGMIGVGEQTGAFRYAPADERTTKAVDGLAAAYRNRRADVVNTLYSANLDRLRAFSNSFRVK